MKVRILSVSPTVYAFLSGLLISVAASAGTSIAFSSPAPSNIAQLAVNGSFAFLSGSCWFFLSERVSRFSDLVDNMAHAMGDREKAMGADSILRSLR